MNRFYRYRDLRSAGIPWSRKHLFQLERLGRFPRRIRLGANTIIWSADEVDAFVAAKAEARREGVAAAG